MAAHPAAHGHRTGWFIRSRGSRDTYGWRIRLTHSQGRLPGARPDGPNALRPPPDQRRGKIEEVGVHGAIWAVEADCHRENSGSDQHAVFGTAAGDQPALHIMIDHKRDADG